MTDTDADHAYAVRALQHFISEVVDLLTARPGDLDNLASFGAYARRRLRFILRHL